jgi:hypothetical protein
MIAINYSLANRICSLLCLYRFKLTQASGVYIFLFCHDFICYPYYGVLGEKKGIYKKIKLLITLENHKNMNLKPPFFSSSYEDIHEF